jgi:hypothetical protein
MGFRKNETSKLFPSLFLLSTPIESSQAEPANSDWVYCKGLLLAALKNQPRLLSFIHGM